MSDGPTGAIRPESEFIQGEAFYIHRRAHPFPTCECSACQIRQLRAQVETLTVERDEARAEHQRWLDEAWQRGLTTRAELPR